MLAGMYTGMCVCVYDIGRGSEGSTLTYLCRYVHGVYV